MSAVRFGKHPVLVWLSSFVAALLLYVLAFPPLEFWFGWRPYYTLRHPHPKWLIHYRNSYDWIGEHTLLKKPMRAYRDWCTTKMEDASGVRTIPKILR